ncbi:peptide chain release factor N(5)-glutamine methyltransferase [Alphaproteobacteria bacterium]|nr:peptide chain release factor N(5)-glutamine methyltransferase [Alphaproteobacteria bacterium]
MHNSHKVLDVYTIIKPEVEKLKKIGNTTPTLDCRILLSYVMGLSETIYSHANINISADQISLFKKLIKDRYKGKPISRIISRKNFWKNTFKINENTLDPRPDSETVIESILKHIPDKSKSFKILDLGSGSGCLGLSLINEYKNSKVTFLDISQNSLQVVEANALELDLFEKSKFVNLDWRNSDWEKKLLKLEKNIKYDLIVSNPPYISSNDIKNLQIEVKEYEPIIALDGGKDGLDAFRFIMPKINNLLKENGKIFIEIGKGQQNQVEKIASDYGLFAIDFVKDFSDIIRVLIFIIK